MIERIMEIDRSGSVVMAEVMSISSLDPLKKLNQVGLELAVEIRAW